LLTVDDKEPRIVADVTNDTGRSVSEYLCPVKKDSIEHLTDVDSPQWDGSSSDCRRSVDGRSEQFSGSLETDRRSARLPRRAESDLSRTLCVDGVNVNTAWTGNSRLSSAMKLKCNVEPHQSQPQEQTAPIIHNPGLPQSPVISSPAEVTQDHKFSVTDKPSSSPSHAAASRPANPSRILSNEPLGAEFDVKQIKVRRGVNTSTSSSTADEFDFFADMEPVIKSSSSLLGLLSAAAAEASSVEPASRLNVTVDDLLDSSVSYITLH